jgi:23S rRNA (adenine2503-C2)-methyltransferase
MHNFYALSQTELEALLGEWGQARFRAKQIWDWVYEKGVTDYAAMSNLPAALRERLQAEVSMGVLELATEQVSEDGTVKRLYRLRDGQLIESVLMKYKDGRRTACISSQAGCAMGCVFCATGQMGFARHLDAAEIVEQAQRYSAELKEQGERLSNVVLMGMGEPFHNYESVLAAIRILMRDLGIGARHITVSTVGLVPQIRRFAQEGLQVRLAISLHASDDQTRSALLPINRKYGIDELLEACRDYVAATGRRITFEWALIRGETDTPEQAEELGRRLRGLSCHVNVIPLNPTQGFAGEASGTNRVHRFVEVLAQHGVHATIRVRRGIDIDAGCGQLKATVARREDGV